MSDDFEEKFKNIISENDFSMMEDPSIGISIHEMAQVLESLNTSAANIAMIITRSLRDRKLEFPDNAINIFRAMHLLSEEFANMIHEEMCEECGHIEEDDEDDEGYLE